MAETSLNSPEPGTVSEGVRLGRVRWTICAMLFVATSFNYMDRQVIAILKLTLEHSVGLGRFFAAGRLIDKLLILIALNLLAPALEKVEFAA
jgi:ACS family hexuronate transporter-like MFS transporter